MVISDEKNTWPQRWEGAAYRAVQASTKMRGIVKALGNRAQRQHAVSGALQSAENGGRMLNESVNVERSPRRCSPDSLDMRGKQANENSSRVPVICDVDLPKNDKDSSPCT